MKAITVEYLIEELDPKNSNKITNVYLEKSIRDAREKYDKLSENKEKEYNLDIRVICLEPGIHTENIIYKETPNLPF